MEGLSLSADFQTNTRPNPQRSLDVVHGGNLKLVDEDLAVGWAAAAAAAAVIIRHHAVVRCVDAVLVPIV